MRGETSARQDRFVSRARAVAVLMDAGFTYWQNEDGSLVKLTDLIEYDLADAPRLSAKEAKMIRQANAESEEDRA